MLYHSELLPPSARKILHPPLLSGASGNRNALTIVGLLRLLLLLGSEGKENEHLAQLWDLPAAEPE